MAHLASRGWLSRVRHGTYITVPLEARNPSQQREDPWIVAAAVFEPAYIGGWSAGEHWGLTDEVFSDIVVFTARRMRRIKQLIQDTTYLASVIQQDRMFGLSSAWRGQTTVQVSNPSRTIADVLHKTSLGGGVRHAAEMIGEYFTGEHRNDAGLLACVARLGNRTILKRLGYIVEALGLDAPDVIDFCRDNVSAGYSKLDPAVKRRGRLMRRWNLEINVTMPE